MAEIQEASPSSVWSEGYIPQLSTWQARESESIHKCVQYLTSPPTALLAEYQARLRSLSLFLMHCIFCFSFAQLLRLDKPKVKRLLTFFVLFACLRSPSPLKSYFFRLISPLTRWPSPASSSRPPQPLRTLSPLCHTAPNSTILPQSKHLPRHLLQEQRPMARRLANSISRASDTSHWGFCSSGFEMC